MFWQLAVPLHCVSGGFGRLASGGKGSWLTGHAAFGDKNQLLAASEARQEPAN